MSLGTLRDDALAIFHAGLAAAAPGPAVSRVLRLEEGILRAGEWSYAPREVEKIWVVGMGKASAAMAVPVTELLGDRIQGGVILVKEGHGIPLSRIQVLEAGHPVPDQAGVEGVNQMMRLLEGTGPQDLVFCLISGGGSALSPAPSGKLTLDDKQEITRLLLTSGATIHEMNTVRKHLSLMKGGQLSRLAHPAPTLSLVLSDVVGDDLGTIASGPTFPDPTTFRDAIHVLHARSIFRAAPAAVRDHLEAGARGEVPETVKAGDPVMAGARNLIVGSNALALEAARRKAEELGYSASLPLGLEEGEAREVARIHVELARGLVEGGEGDALPACILSGGETTVAVRGGGLGGRNQEFSLAAALAMEGLDRILVLSGGTDGTDGLTDAAGALADGTTVGRGRAAGMEARDYLDRNDAFNFFHPLGDLLVTGPTLTNVMDLRIVLVGKHPS